MVRFLCVSLNPGGGAMGPAMATLGFKCYDTRQAFKARGAGIVNRADPTRWIPVIKGRKHFDVKMVQDHDVAVGMPTSSCWENVFRKCPEYTKVILCVEPDKRKWANSVLTEVLPKVDELEQVKYMAGSEAAAFFRSSYPSEVITPTEMSYAKSRKQREEAKRLQAEVESAIKKLRSAEARPSLGGTVRKLPGASGQIVDEKPVKASKEQIRQNARLIKEQMGKKKIIISDEDALAEAESIEEMTVMMIEGLSDWEFNVSDTVPKDRLLIFTPGKDSWEQLCKFVAKDVPIEFNLDKGEDSPLPFPVHTSGKEEMEHFIQNAHRAAKISQRARLLVFWWTFGLVGYFILWPMVGVQNSLMTEIMAIQKEFESAFGDEGKEEQEAYEAEQKRLKEEEEEALQAAKGRK